MREAPRVCGKFDKSHQTVTPGNCSFDCDGSCVGPMKKREMRWKPLQPGLGLGEGGKEMLRLKIKGLETMIGEFEGSPLVTR